MYHHFPRRRARAERPGYAPGVGGGRIPRGRLKRIGKVAGMAARASGSLLATSARRLAGEGPSPQAEAARRLLETLGELKGAALKVGQALSLAGGALPDDVREVVSRLFSQAPPVPFEDVAVVLEEELGRPHREVFPRFEEEPFAAASLGQVHRATLASGEEVAVKVQYPGVAEALEDDLRNLGTVARAVGLGISGAGAYADELASSFREELDYELELRRLEQFRAFYAPEPDLVVPRSYPALCSRRVLVLERLEGPTLDAFTREDAPADVRFRVAEQLVRATYGPFVSHGAIHGDTHPGNFVVLRDGRLGVLDFGATRSFSEGFRGAYHELLASAVRGEIPDYVALVRRAGFTIRVPDARARSLLEEIAGIVSRPLCGPYDFGQDRIVEDLQALKLKRAPDLLRVLPPAEGILFYRSLAGLHHDVRALRAAGDFRPVLRRLLGQRAAPPES